MLALFPELLDWSFFAPTLLRVALAFLFFGAAKEFFAFAKFETETVNARSFPLLALLLGALALLFFTGALIQAAAAIGFSFALLAFVLRGHSTRYLTKPREHYALVMAVSLSLIVLGAGAFAFDLPL